MSISKKHFRRLAQALANARPHAVYDSDTAHNTWDACVQEIATACKELNYKFDPGKFWEACKTWEKNAMHNIMYIPDSELKEIPLTNKLLQYLAEYINEDLDNGLEINTDTMRRAVDAFYSIYLQPNGEKNALD